MLTFTEAQRIITALSRSFGQEEIALADADGRVLAEDIYADRDYPPFNRAAMDGYAINVADWESGNRNFGVQQIIYAGESATQELAQGACYKIMTGAPVPPSANVVIRREDAMQTGDIVSFTVESVKPWQSISRQGEDMLKGDLILPKGTKCTFAAISILASLGKSIVQVQRLPKVALFTTGNELVEVGMPVSDIQIRNSNQYLLRSLLKKWQINPALCKHVFDDKEQLKSALSEALNCDIIITCGGVSAGDADYLPEVLAGLGVKKLFHKVAIKPGKPIWCGQMPNGGVVFALPGNPVSCMVTFKLFIETYLTACLGTGVNKTIVLPFKGNRTHTANLDEFFPVSISGEPASAQAITINSSGDIRLGLHADAFAHHSVDIDELSDGTVVNCYLL
ncbi:molybdopterin molybdotransferase MoeA [Mucilaginibacter sp. AW1-3]